MIEVDTMRKLASIQKIEDIKRIEGADLICAYKVLGWWVVDRVNQYRIGDYVIYCEIDSWIPNEIAPFLSKGKEPRVYEGVVGERLRTVKLRGAISQGLILPLGVLAEYEDNMDVCEGMDVTDILGIKKWEAQIPACLAGLMKGNFPTFIRKTDQERIQNLQQEITEAYECDAEFEVTIKLDGSSCTVYHNNGEVGVCSRNLELKLDQENNSFVYIAKSTGLLDALKELGENLAVQGELMGPGIQGNIEKLDKHELFIFDIYDIDAGRYLSPIERVFKIANLMSLGYNGKVVPAWAYNYTLPTDDIDQLLQLADGASLNAHIREGLVFKRNDGAFSFKIISNDFLVREK